MTRLKNDGVLPILFGPPDDGGNAVSGGIFGQDRAICFAKP